MSSPKDGLTLLFFHCIGGRMSLSLSDFASTSYSVAVADKEQWEPVIAYLFDRQQKLNPGQHRIREAWAFDWPTHGDAAVLNRELLGKRTDSVCEYRVYLSVSPGPRPRL